MEPIDFSIDQLDKYSMWFMLDKIKDGPVTLIRRTPAGDEKFINSGLYGFSAFRMKDGHLLLGINHFLKFTYKNNLVAISNGVEEIVNIQMFENIREHYNVPVENLDKGYFVFVDSMIVAPEDEWRCDNTSYGPLGYGIAEGVMEKMVKGFDELVSYESIFSIDGTAYLVYIQYKNDDEYRYHFANKMELPICGVTISESLKLISEWATVSKPPFNNAQVIAQDAKDFLDKLDFDWSLIDYQADMYVAEYIKGNENARMRPPNVKPLSEELDLFIKKKMSYRCLSALISLYPNSWDVQEIIDNEETALLTIHDRIWFYIKNQDKPELKRIFWENVERALKLHSAIKTTGIF